MKNRSAGSLIVFGGLLLLGIYLAFLPSKRLSPNSLGSFFQGEPEAVTEAFDYDAFSRIAVLRGGRVKPIDSVARNCLLVMSNKRTAVREGADGKDEKLPAVEWFAEVLLKPEKGNKILTFLVDHDQVLGLLGIKQGDKKRFSYEELEEHFVEIEKEARKAGEMETADRGPFEQNVLDLYRSLLLYRKLQNTLQPPPIPSKLAQDEEFGLQDILRKDDEPGYVAEYERFRSLAKELADNPEEIAPGSQTFSRLVAMMDRYSNWTLFAEFHAIPPAKDSDSEDWSRIGETLVGTDARHAKPSMMRDLDFRIFPAQIRDLVKLEPKALQERIEALRDEHKMNPNVLFATKYADAIKLRGEVDPLVKDYQALALAYKNDDHATFNATVAKLRKAIDERAGEATNMLGFEKAFNGYEPFYRSLVVYVIGMLVACLSWLFAAGSDKEKSGGGTAENLRQAAFWLMVIAFAAHTFGLFARMYVQGRPPVTTLYSSALFIGWAAVLLCVFIERYHKFGIASAMGSFLGFGALVIAHNLSLDSSLNPSGDTMEMMRAVLDDNFWLATHVVTVTIGYSTTFLAGFVAIAFVLLHVLASVLGNQSGFGQKIGAVYKRMEKDAGTMIYGVTCFALFFSFVGTVLGGIWADQSWGRFWGWDAKENGAILIVLWNAIILHARWAGIARTRGIACLAIFGNVVTSWSWFGTNMLGVGLHSYGFMDKAFVPLMVFILVQLGLIVLGSLPKPNKP